MIGSNANGHTTISVVDNKLHPVDADWRNLTGDAATLLRSIERIRERDTFKVTWNAEPNNDVAIDINENPQLVFQLVRCHNLIFSDGKPFMLPDSQYKFIRLSPDNHELQRLVLTEPSIRKYVLKDENYMLLIKADETKQFATALRKFGYLI